MTYKEQIINIIDRLINEFGYTKKEIARRIGVHQSKLNYIYQAKRLDRNLLTLLQMNFAELQLPKIPSTKSNDIASLKEVAKAADEMLHQVRDNPDAVEYLKKYMGDLYQEVEKMKKRIEQLEDKNK